MEFVRLLLVFLHLLGMGMLVAMFFLQMRAGAGAPLNKGWLHGAGLQLLTGLALVGLAPVTDQDYDHVKIGVKLLVLVAIGVLALVFARKPAAPAWLPRALAGLVVLNVGVAVFWT
ncbi:hypothetical protein [Umezawaea sp.]|uniref:hypothetical protein n=1 Tax=Umezawaea sp. TaxID=1955258 RepID=UPI002ED3E852